MICSKIACQSKRVWLLLLFILLLSSPPDAPADNGTIVAYRLSPGQPYRLDAKPRSKKPKQEKEEKSSPTIPPFMEVIIVTRAGRSQLIGDDLDNQLWKYGTGVSHPLTGAESFP